VQSAQAFTVIREQVFNLTVAGAHTYYVGQGTGSMLTHNAKACKVHGNSLDSPKETSLYRLNDANTGEYLKTGITANPRSRYSGPFMQDKSMEILTSGPRREMANLERFIVERDPGPLNKERFAGTRLDDVPGKP